MLRKEGALIIFNTKEDLRKAVKEGLIPRNKANAAMKEIEKKAVSGGDALGTLIDF